MLDIIIYDCSPACLRLKQKDDEFEASRDCIDRPSLKNEIQNQIQKQVLSN